MNGETTIAVGTKNIAAVDVQTGTERWRRQTHSNTTNSLWDKASGTVLYADEKTLHTIDTTTGRPLKDIPLHLKSRPIQIRQASPDVVVLISSDQVCAYNFKTGATVVSGGKLIGFFAPVAIADHWPTVDQGQDLSQSFAPPSDSEWQGIRQATLLSPDFLTRLQQELQERDRFMEAYETESPEGVRKVWWIDPQSNAVAGMGVADDHHDVSVPLGIISAVSDKQLWGAKIVAN